MPVNSKPHIIAYYQINLCFSCNSSKEAVSYLFFTCFKLNCDWNFIIHLPFKLTGYTTPMMTSNFFLFLDFFVPEYFTLSIAT